MIQATLLWLLYFNMTNLTGPGMVGDDDHGFGDDGGGGGGGGGPGVGGHGGGKGVGINLTNNVNPDEG